MFAGISFLTVGLILLFIAAVLFVGADKNVFITDGNLPALIDWSFLLFILAVFCLLSNYLSFESVFLLMSVISGMAYIAYLMHRKRESIEPLSFWHAIEYVKSFFWIFLMIFLIRGFVVDLSIIPSSSMRPTLKVGDFVLVNKYDYGLKVPISNYLLWPNNAIQRGDVIVFDYPLNPSVQYVKRVIGIPGDTVKMWHKKLFINGKKIQDQFIEHKKYLENSYSVDQPFAIMVDHYRETLGERIFSIYRMANRPTLDPEGVKKRNTCKIFGDEGFECKVPADQYFVLGDNRDNSEDGRYWGFVPERNIEGRPFLVWMNFKSPGRIGTQVR